MTFDEVFKARNGFWDKEYAMVQEGQYVKCIAIGRPDKYELTDFGKTLIAVANTSASNVELSEPKKRGRKAKADEVPDLDDLDI